MSDYALQLSLHVSVLFICESFIHKEVVIADYISSMCTFEPGDHWTQMKMLSVKKSTYCVDTEVSRYGLEKKWSNMI